MDLGALFWIAVGVALLWWLFSREPGGSQNRPVEVSDPRTGRIKIEVRQRRQAQHSIAITKPDPFEINHEIREVLEALENSDQNIFLTGKAGTGKSTLLRYFRATTKKAPVVVAPTGVAAVNVQGQTIHSFFGWGITVTPDRVRKLSYQKAKVYRKMQMLIIDEISMVRADIFDCIDKFLRLNTGRPNAPFGGIQIVAIGDLYQLPPVVKAEERKLFETRYDTPFFFSTEGFKLGRFKKFELKTVFRQKDPDFVRALNAIREGSCEQKHLDLLNANVVEDEPSDFDDYVHLVTTNNMAKEINGAKMEQLAAKPVTYQGTLSGNFKERDAPTELTLSLKVGARVMLLNNDKERRWVNGDIVNILETKASSVIVEFDDRTVEEIAAWSWETVRFIFDEEEQKVVPTIVGSFTQLPVKPAWAITIHKSQGQTFDKMFMDLGSGAFAEGQTYVALSRCKSLSGLKLAAPLVLHDVFVNDRVKEFMAFSTGSSQQSAEAHSPSKPAESENYELDLGEPKGKSLSETEQAREDFVISFIRQRKNKKYKGVHVVYSGFNEAFRQKFKEDPVAFVKTLEQRGLVRTHLAKGGVILYEVT